MRCFDSIEKVRCFANIVFVVTFFCRWFFLCVACRYSHDVWCFIWARSQINLREQKSSWRWRSYLCHIDAIGISNTSRADKKPFFNASQRRCFACVQLLSQLSHGEISAYITLLARYKVNIMAIFLTPHISGARIFRGQCCRKARCLARRLTCATSRRLAVVVLQLFDGFVELFFSCEVVRQWCCRRCRFRARAQARRTSWHCNIQTQPPLNHEILTLKHKKQQNTQKCNKKKIQSQTLKINGKNSVVWNLLRNLTTWPATQNLLTKFNINRFFSINRFFNRFF